MGNVDDSRLFWFAKVVDVDDPLMLNRVRVQFETYNNTAVLDSIVDNKDGKTTKTTDGIDLLPEFKWSEIDSFCCLPLIPLFLKITPKVGESVNVYFPNSDYKFGEQYYTMGTLSSPLTAYRENFNIQRMFATKNRIKNPMLLKNPTNNEYYNSETKGVFIEPGDVGLMGRGTCDIILKDNEMILRAGKSTTIPNNANKEIKVNSRRSFVQLSDFNKRESKLPDYESSKLQEIVSYTKTLIEWNVLNPENMFDVFNYEITLYRLPEKPEYTTKNLTIDSTVDNTDKSVIYKVVFNGQSMFDMSETILKFISQCENGELNLPPYSITSVKNQFPLYFRPSPETYLKMTDPGSGSEYINTTNCANKIDYKTQNNGYGLIFSQGKYGNQFDIVKDIQEQIDIRNDLPITYNIGGGDKILLLSHESRIPSKKQITLDSNTVYGIAQSYIVSNILPNTDPMVRGDELMKFLNVVVKFLISHVHPFPGLPPVLVGTDGTRSDDILEQLSVASDTILNQNIRIN